jgi:hypothetical protein
MWNTASTPEFSVSLVNKSQYQISHAPSGCTYVTGQTGRHPDLNEPDQFSSGNSGSWSCQIDAHHWTSFSLAKSANLPAHTVADREHYRRTFGDRTELYQCKPLSATAPPWDEGMVSILTMSMFITMDLGGYIEGRDAYPDVIDCTNSDLPIALRRMFKNPCAGHAL